MTDLSSERLDELARWLPDDYPRLPVHPDTYAAELTYGELFHLLAMAKRTEQAERERDALRGLLADAYSDRESVRDPDEECYWCFGGAPRGYEMNPASLPHVDDCLGERIRIALAQPTEGGE